MSAAGKSAGKAPARPRLSRSRARLAAVQALYQMDLAETDLSAVHRGIQRQPRWSTRPRTTGSAGADVEHLAARAQGRGRPPARDRSADRQQLATGWRLVRIDSILRAILRAGAFELMELADVPARVVISEYVEVAHAFFEGDEPRSSTACSTSSPASCANGELPTRG